MLASVYRAATAGARSGVPGDPRMMKLFTELIPAEADLYLRSEKNGLRRFRNARRRSFVSHRRHRSARIVTDTTVSAATAGMFWKPFLLIPARPLPGGFQSAAGNVAPPLSFGLWSVCVRDARERFRDRDPPGLLRRSPMAAHPCVNGTFGASPLVREELFPPLGYVNQRGSLRRASSITLWRTEPLQPEWGRGLALICPSAPLRSRRKPPPHCHSRRAVVPRSLRLVSLPTAR